MNEHKDSPYLAHILDAIKDIERSLKNISKVQFIANNDIRDANIRRLEIIGEAVKNLSNTFKEEHKDIEWNKIAETRNIIIHKYFDVDLDIVWDIIKKDIPKLKEKLEKLTKSAE